MGRLGTAGGRGAPSPPGRRGAAAPRRRRRLWAVGLLGALGALGACAADASGITDSERDNADETSGQALQSALDAADAAVRAEGETPPPGALRASAGRAAGAAPAACSGGGTLTDAATAQDANTVRHLLTYSACQVGGGRTWDGNQQVTVATTDGSRRTATVVNALTETVVAGPGRGGTRTIATTAPIVIGAVGTKDGGRVTRVLVSGIDHRERRDPAGTLLHSLDVSYTNMVLSDTYGAADPNGLVPLTARLANGQQTAHHLLWKVTATIFHDGTAWAPRTCSCTPVAGTAGHRLAWDDGSRTLNLVRANNGCGAWTLSGVDAANSLTVSAGFAGSCP